MSQVRYSNTVSEQHHVNKDGRHVFTPTPSLRHRTWPPLRWMSCMITILACENNIDWKCEREAAWENELIAKERAIR